MSSLIDLSCLARFKEKLLEEAGSLAGLPLGFEYFQTNPNIQAGSLPLTGGLYSRSIYSDLWAWLQEQDGYLISEAEWQAKANANGGAVPFYSDGDGSTTFRVPALIVWVKGKNGNEAVGDYLADSFASHKHDVSATSNADIGAGGTHTYEASTETRPKTIVGIYCVIAFGTVTNSGSMDLEAVQSLLLETQTVVEDGKAIFSEAVKGIYSNTGEQRDRDPSKPTYGLK